MGDTIVIIFRFIKFIFLPKTLHWQGLILKKRFTKFGCIPCYFADKNRNCPKYKKGHFKCGDNFYFQKVNNIRRGIGYSGLYYRRTKCRSKKNLNRIRKELERKQNV